MIFYILSIGNLVILCELIVDNRYVTSFEDKISVKMYKIIENVNIRNVINVQNFCQKKWGEFRSYIRSLLEWVGDGQCSAVKRQCVLESLVIN